jgi:hypothetical protein
MVSRKFYCAHCGLPMSDRGKTIICIAKGCKVYGIEIKKTMKPTKQQEKMTWMDPRQARPL